MEINSILKKLKIAFFASWNNFIAQVPSILVAIIIITVGIILASFLTKLFRQAISKQTQDPLMTNFLSRSLKVGLVIAVIMLALRQCPRIN